MLRFTDIDPIKESKGVELDYDTGNGVIKVTIARSKSDTFLDARDSLIETYSERFPDVSETEIRKKAVIEALAKHVLIGWSVPEVEYSVKNAIEVLTNDLDFREWVSIQASKNANFRKEKLEKREGNLERQ